MIKKLNTYFWYFFEYLKHGDLLSVYASIKYVLFKKSHSKDRIIQTSVGKFFCRKNTNDFQFANLRYEWGVKSFILSHHSEYSVFIDGGSCVGAYAVLLPKYNIRCFAFEPLTCNYDVLVKNLELNNLTTMVTAFNLGFGNENKKVRFKLNPVNTGASHIDLNNNQDGEEVELCKFDSVLTKLNLARNENILFKLDVEGMETEALQGATDFILQYPQLTFILEEKFTGNKQIRKILDELGSFEYGKIDAYNMFARKILR